MMSDFKVHIPDEARCHEFAVVFHGPRDSESTSHEWESIYVCIYLYIMCTYVCVCNIYIYTHTTTKT